MPFPRRAAAGYTRFPISRLLARLADAWAMRAQPARSAPRMEEIEPRLLYSADPALLGVSLAGAQPVVEQRIVGQGGEFQGTAGVTDSDGRTHELLVVGADIENSDTLLKGLAGDGRDIEVLVLDPNRDSIAQISQALAGRQDLSAIHILSHGAQGELALGATRLDSAELAARAGEIGLWGDALKPGGDILLYGCDVAADDVGQAFVRQFAALAGADVAASDDLTGAATRHGDWTLEYATGRIETGVAFTAAAQQAWGGLLETLVNGNAGDNQTQAAVAVGANGNTVVVWTADKAEDGDRHGIFGQLFDAHGDPVGIQFQVNTSFHDEQQNAAVGMAADGSFVVTWQSRSGDLGESGWGIRAQRFDQAGNKIASEFVVNALTANEQTSPAIAVAADGQFVIAWASSVNNDVYVRHFDRLGNALSGDIQANPVNIGATQSAPSVGIAKDGSFLVAWQSDSGGTGKSVFAQRFTALGMPSGLSFRVNAWDANDQIAPTVAMNGNGYAVIAWTSANQDGDKNGIYAQRYNPDGSAAGGEFRVNSITVNDQSHPSAAIDGAGNVLIAWSSVGQDNGGSTGVYAQRYDAGGAAVGAAFLVNTTTAQNQQAPVVAMSPLGSAAIAWEGNGVGDTNGVFVASYVAANTPPTANADATTVLQGSQVMGAAPGVLVNDSDPDAGATIAVAAVSAGVGGTPVAVPAGGVTISGVYGELTLNPDGSYSYIANAAAAYALGAGQTASEVFTYVIKDNNNAAASATLTITITGANDAPVAANDRYAVDKNKALAVSAGDVFRNDRDPDTVPVPDRLSVTGVGIAGGAAGTVGQVLVGQYGSLTLNADGSLTYTPNSGNAAVSTLASGSVLTDLFTYRVSDAAGASSQAVIAIDIVGSNTAPVVNDDSYALQQGASLVVGPSGVLRNDFDQESNQLSAALVLNPSNGTLKFNSDGSFVYTPNASFSGVDSFTYRASDGSLTSARDATVSLTVIHVNHTPAATDDAVGVTQDLTASAAARGVLTNDIDADSGDVLAVTAIESGVDKVAVAAGNSAVISSDYGTLTIYSDGSYNYVANGLASRALGAGAVSSDSFVYTISDGNGGSASANLVFTVTGTNDVPTITGMPADQRVADNATISPFTTVLVGDVDNPSETLTVTISLDIAAKGGLSNFGGGSYDTGTSVYTVTGTAAQVTAAVNGLVFTPAANRVAPGSSETTTFRISAFDGSVTTADYMTSVISTSINDAPTGSATAALAAGAEDTAYTVAAASLLQGFGDVDGDMLSVANLTADHGTVTDNQDGTYTIAPAANYNGTLSLRYDVVDGNGGIVGAMQSITLAAINDAPTGSATAALAAGAEDTAYTVAAASLVQGFGDVDGDTLSVANLTADHGTVTDNQDGTYTITPAADYNGTLSLRYDVVDGNGGIVGAMQSITLAAINDAPTGSATAALAAGAEDTAYTVAAASLVQGFGDVDGDTLSVANLTADHGTVTDNQDGTYTIAPAADYNGALSLRYDVVDGNGGIAGAMQSITLAAINDAPTGSATAALAAGAEDTAYTVAAASLLQGFSDVDGDMLSVANLTADHGTVTDNQDGTYTIAPAADYNGTLSLRYDVVDGNGGIAGAMQSITLAAINDAPTGSATAALAAGAEDTAYIVAAASLLQGFGDVDGDMLSVSNLTADHGTVTDNQDGTYTITPAADYNGALSLRYDVVDGNGGIAGAMQSITLAAINDAPTGSATAALAAGAEDAAYTVAAASLLQGFGDVDGDMLSVSNLTADHGTVTDNQDGTYTIAPAADYNGALSLRYDVVDGNGGIAGAMQSITLAAVNDAPTGSATAALAAGVEDTAYTVAAASLLQGFGDVDGDTLSVSNLTADHGTVTDNQDGTYTITPAADYNGTLSLRYDVVDGNGGIAGAVQSITLAAVNDAPTGSAVAALAAGVEDTAYTVAAASLLQGFGDVDGDTLSVSNLTADHGTVTDNQDGTYTIAPAADYNGTLSLRYDVVDGNGGIAGAMQNITLAAINDAPTGSATAALAAGAEDTAYIVAAASLLQGFGDVDGDMLSVSNLTADHGTVTDNQDGTYTITPSADYNGTLSLRYDV
ncbi:cadherin-like domain-containing protein, partial [Noviherbaspirillum soli]|uniref:cadherin-like domain-containing protein n=1 Tax=Noviherbaspirillum soli TaxID=1064518 RepID=UPI001E354F98